jgi:hypothetical protein
MVIGILTGLINGISRLMSPISASKSAREMDGTSSAQGIHVPGEVDEIKGRDRLYPQ